MGIVSKIAKEQNINQEFSNNQSNDQELAKIVKKMSMGLDINAMFVILFWICIALIKYFMEKNRKICILIL